MSRKCPGTCSEIAGFVLPEIRFPYYAHMEIVVVLIVVKKLGFLVITRDHGSFGGRHQVEILPTDLPELFKPARDLLEPRKFKILFIQVFSCI